MTKDRVKFDTVLRLCKICLKKPKHGNKPCPWRLYSNCGKSLADRDSGAKDQFATCERDGYMVTSAKCLADTGSDSGVSSVTKVMMTLGHKDTLIHTCIGSKNEVVEEM